MVGTSNLGSWNGHWYDNALDSEENYFFANPRMLNYICISFVFSQADVERVGLDCRVLHNGFGVNID